MKKTKLNKTEKGKKVLYWMRYYFQQIRDCKEKGYTACTRDYQHTLSGTLQLAKSMGYFTQEQFDKLVDIIWRY